MSVDANVDMSALMSAVKGYDIRDNVLYVRLSVASLISKMVKKLKVNKIVSSGDDVTIYADTDKSDISPDIAKYVKSISVKIVMSRQFINDMLSQVKDYVTEVKDVDGDIEVVINTGQRVENVVGKKEEW